MTIKHWFLDFDDTLASGSITWGYQHAFPKLVRQHQLPFDQAQFHQAFLIAQEQANVSDDMMGILGDLFTKMAWPLDLRQVFISDLLANYQPELFDDTLAFLERLLTAQQDVIILSNNPTVPDLVDRLKLRRYVSAVITPKQCADCQPKPHPSLWHYVLSKYPHISPASSVMVGDDPWSDGLFAENCGLRCYIIDRFKRYDEPKYLYKSSLLDIPIQ